MKYKSINDVVSKIRGDGREEHLLSPFGFTYRNMCTHTHTHTHAHTHTHMHIHIHTHAHTRRGKKEYKRSLNVIVEGKENNYGGRTQSPSI